MKVISGIYIIRCKPTGKVYVGSSLDIYRRWYLHKSALRHGRHHSLKLQRAWNKYGEDAFEFEIAEEVIDGLLPVYEQVYINSHNSKANGYNILGVAGNVYTAKTRRISTPVPKIKLGKLKEKIIERRIDQIRDKQGKFTTDRLEPRDAKLSLRIEASVMAKIQAIPDWQEKVRSLLYELVKPE